MQQQLAQMQERTNQTLHVSAQRTTTSLTQLQERLKSIDRAQDNITKLSGDVLSLQDIQDILRIKLLGVIPESENVLQASNQGTPAIHMANSDVSEAYKDVIDRFLGEDKPMRFIEAEKAGFFKRLFGGK